MAGSEVNARSIWAERALALLLLPVVFIALVGGGAAFIWLWQNYRAQLWIGICFVVVAYVLMTSGVDSTSRWRRRSAWQASNDTAGHNDSSYEDDDEVPYVPEDFASTASQSRNTRRRAVLATGDLADADPHELMIEVLAGIESMQQHLAILMGEVSAERRVSSGRHAGPVTVDIRDDVDDLSGFDDLDDDYDDTDFADPDTGAADPGDDDPQVEGPFTGGPGSSDLPGRGSRRDRHRRASPDRSLDHDAALGGLGDAGQPPGAHRPLWDSIPAPREPVVIQLPRDDEQFDEDDEQDDEDDEDDYFGEDDESVAASFDDLAAGLAAGLATDPPARPEDSGADDDGGHLADGNSGDRENGGPRDAR